MKNFGDKIMTIEGFYNVKPQIKDIKFDIRGKISFYFEDGRIVISPVSAILPSKS